MENNCINLGGKKYLNISLLVILLKWYKYKYLKMNNYALFDCMISDQLCV